MKPEYDAFISYSSRDKFWVNACLLCELESAGLDICIDRRDFDLGIPLLVNMERAVERSRKTVLVLSPQWIESEWTNFESLMLQTSDLIGLGHRVLPLLFERCQIPLRLRIFTYADFTSQDQWGTEMHRLIATIKEARQTDMNLSSSSGAAGCEGNAEILYSLSFEGECEGLTLAELQQIEALLQKYAKDANLRVRRIERGSVVLEIISTAEGYYRLCRLMRAGKLSDLVGTRIIGIAPVVKGKEEVTKRLASASKGITIPTSYEKIPLSGVICRDDYIEDMEAERETAKKLLPGKTGLLSDVVVYVTAHDEYYYAHSNYVNVGYSYATKMCSTDISDLFYILVSLVVSGGWPSPERERIIYNAHVNNVQYLISEKIMNEDGTCEIDFNGARNIRIVKDIS